MADSTCNRVLKREIEDNLKTRRNVKINTKFMELCKFDIIVSTRVIEFLSQQLREQLQDLCNNQILGSITH